MTVIGYDSDIVTAESADDEEQDEEAEYVFSLCWSVTVWITFEDNLCIFSVFVTGDDDDDDEEGDFCLVVGDSAQSAQLQFEDNISRKLEGLRTLHPSAGRPPALHREHHSGTVLHRRVQEQCRPLRCHQVCTSVL